MKHGKLNIDMIRAIRVAVLLSVVMTSLSAIASNRGAYGLARDSVGGEVVFVDYEQQPQFPGGETALLKYLQDNIKYPPKALKDSIQGRVVVQFVVDKAGSVGEVKVVRSVDKDLDKEAVRLIKTLPKFIPGRQNGQAVSVWYTLPVTFKLKG